MKYLKTRNQYKASNVLLDMNKREAWSYDWWQFLKEVNGKLIFNSYAYSPSTQGHQRKVLSKLRLLGLEPDLTIKCRQGLQEQDWHEWAELEIQCKVKELEMAINKKGSRKTTNERRRKEIEELNDTLIKLKDFTKTSKAS